jgi:hypothetical protein
LVGNRGIAARKLFHDKCIGKCIETRTAKVLGNRDAEEPELGHFLIEVGGKGFRIIKFAGAGANPVIGKPARRIMDMAVDIRRKLWRKDMEV